MAFHSVELRTRRGFRRVKLRLGDGHYINIGNRFYTASFNQRIITWYKQRVSYDRIASTIKISQLWNKMGMVRQFLTSDFAQR